MAPGRGRGTPGPAVHSLAAAAVIVAVAISLLGAFRSRAALAVALAPTPSVAVLEPAAADPVMTEAASRMAAELSAAGMRASLVACASGFDPRCPAPAGAGEMPDATVAILRAAGRTVIEVKVTADHAQHVLVRRMEIGPDRGGDDPSVLAIRAVELLRATLMQQTTEARAPAPPPARSVELPPAARRAAVAGAEGTPTAKAVAAGSDTNWSVSAGAALLQSVAQLGVAFGPQARVAFRPYQTLALEARVAVLALAPDLTAPAGRASLQQQLGGVGATYALSVGRRLIPTLSAGLGVYHIQVTGHASSSAAGISSALWAAQLAAGLGLAVRLSEAYALRLGAEAIFLDPSPGVTIGAADAFHAGRPLLLFSLSLERGLPGTGGGALH